MRKPVHLLVLLATPVFLAACDASDPTPSDTPFALQIAIDQGDRAFDVRCGGEDATAHRAAARLQRGREGHAELALSFAVSQQRGTLREDCQVHVVFPLRAGALTPGTYEVGVTDRAYLLYVREERGGEREVFRFGHLTGRLRLDRVGDDAVAGHLAVHAVTDRGTASASADFRAALTR